MAELVKLIGNCKHLISQPQELKGMSPYSIQNMQLEVGRLGEKLSQYRAQLRNSNPFYQQIPYLLQGLEQQDCSIAPGAWKRETSRAAGADAAHVGELASHAFVDIRSIEDLQQAFAVLESLRPEPSAVDAHEQLVSQAGALLQANVKISGWERMLQVCNLLLDGDGRLSDDDMQELQGELQALAIALSPRKLALQLQEHHLQQQTSISSTALPAALVSNIVLDVVAEYAQSRRDLPFISLKDAAEMCHQLQQCAFKGNISMGASVLAGQYDMLRLLFSQQTALDSALQGGMASSSALLAPVGFTFFDAAVLVVPEDTQLLIWLMGLPVDLQEQQSRLADTARLGVMDFVYGSSSSASVEVFQSSAWLPAWLKSLKGVAAAAAGSGADGGGVRDGSASTMQSSLPAQLAAAIAVVAACAAAAGACVDNSDNILQHAALHTSAMDLGHIQEQLQQLQQLQKERSAVHSRISKHRQSR